MADFVAKGRAALTTLPTFPLPAMPCFTAYVRPLPKAARGQKTVIPTLPLPQGSYDEGSQWAFLLSSVRHNTSGSHHSPALMTPFIMYCGSRYKIGLV